MNASPYEPPSVTSEQIVDLLIERIVRGRLPVRSALRAIARLILALPDDSPRLRLVEAAVCSEALSRADGNISAAARLLQMDRKALDRRIDRRSWPPPKDE